MHICFLCDEYPPGRHGGVGTFTRTLGRALAARGHRVTVVGFYPTQREGKEDDDGVSVVRLSYSPVPKTGFLVNGMRFGRVLRALHRESPVDILEGQELSLALAPARFPAVKVIRMHGGHRFSARGLGRAPLIWKSWLERRSFARADALCAVSAFVAETTRELLKLDHTPMEILPNPVDLVTFYPRPREIEQSGLILFVGTVFERKGIRQLIQAMPRVIDAVPDARLMVVGHDWRHPSTGRSFIEELQASMPSSLAGRVRFEGPVDHSRMPDIIAKAQVCAFPYHFEALPITWLEVMAMGKAVVVSRTGPGPEIFKDGISGLLCDPYDPASIAAKVIALLADDPLRRRLGDHARRDAVDRFSLDTLVQRNVDFYQRCIAEREGAFALSSSVRLP